MVITKEMQDKLKNASMTLEDIIKVLEENEVIFTEGEFKEIYSKDSLVFADRLLKSLVRNELRKGKVY